MTKTQQALKLALEALESCGAGDYSTGHVIHPSFNVDAVNRAIDAVDEALADHSTNRPISRLDDYPKEQVAAAKEDVLSAVEHHGLSEQPAQQQEPVVWGVDWGKAGDQSCVSIIKRLPDGGIEVLATEYGPPASKPWVGLTNQELIDLTAIYSGAPLYCAIEAKLREKNT